MLILESLFFGAIGIASLGAAALIALFDILIVCMMINNWSDFEFTLKERIWITLLFAMVITWGAFIAYEAATYGWAWVHHMA